MAHKPQPEDADPMDDLSAEEAMKRLRAASKASSASPAEGAKAAPASPQAGAPPEPLGDDISVDEAMKRARAAGGGMAKAGALPTQQFIAEHTLTADETLSHLALKYYGHATPPYWQLIYEANKALIGDNPNRVRPGLVLKIPALPENMK